MHSTTIDNVSYFAAPISNTDPQKIMSLYAVFKFIQDTDLKSVTEGIRHGLKDKNVDLPYVTSSGVFVRRANDQLVTYSGVICMDLDDVNIHFKHILMSDHFLNPAMVFVSPSGNGLKLFIRIQGSTAGHHLKYWLAIEKYLLTHFCLQPCC